jgi:hypothetical protein
MANEQQRLGRLKIEHLNLRYQYNRVRAKIELYAGRSLDQLAAMETASPADADRGSPFRDDAEQPSRVPPNSRPSTTTPRTSVPKSSPALKAPSRTATPRDVPAKPKPRKEQVDTRVARARSGSEVVQASAESEDTPKAGSAWAFVKQLTQRKEPPKAESLPYGNAKPSATTARR